MDTIDMRHSAQPGKSATVPDKWWTWGRRIGWLLLIWTLSVVALGAVAGAMRLFMHGLGMH